MSTATRRARPLRLPYRPTSRGLLARLRTAYHPGFRALLNALPDKPRARLEHEAAIAAGHSADTTAVERLVIVEDDATGWVGIASTWTPTR